MEQTLAVIMTTLLTASTGTQCFAATPSIHAGDLEFSNGMAFVLIARVIDVRHDEGQPMAYYKADLEPRACVAGLFDIAAHPMLTISFSAGGMTLLPTAPRAGDLVLAVVYDVGKVNNDETRGFGLANGLCRFMPREEALVVLKGMDDPMIMEVVKKMQDARRPATQPATTPAKD